MKEPESVTTSERAGQWLGRVWHKVACRERRAIHWLAAKGLPPRVGQLLFFSVKVIVFAVLLYSVLWIALLLVFMVGSAWTARNLDQDQAQPEWRDGMLGFGLYHPDGSRIDPHDP